MTVFGRRDGLILECRMDGTILRIVQDGLGIARRFSGAGSLVAAADDGSVEKTETFLARLRLYGLALGWELNVPVEDDVVVALRFFGVRDGDRALVVAVASESVDEVFGRKFEVTGRPPARDAPREQDEPALRLSDAGLYDQLSRLNNEAVNLQRELARANRALEAERDRFQVTLASIADAIITVGEGGLVTFLNAAAARLTGWPPAEALGRPLADVFRSVDIATGAPVVIRPSMRRPAVCMLAPREGPLNAVEYTCAPISDAGGGAGQVITFRDVQARHLAELERTRMLDEAEQARRNAEEASAARLRFLGIISHELRTPLTSIKGFASALLAESAWDADLQREFIAIVDQEADKLVDLVEQLLTVSRLQANMLTVTPVTTHLRAIVDEVSLQLEAATRAHAFALELPEDLPALSADAHRIGQVVVNLVGNAAKYSPEGSSILLRGAPEGDFVRIDVCDLGIGIAAEDRQHIFEAFRQVRREDAERGAGLGLAICKGLVEAHGGRIWLQERPGPGTTVCFTVPVATAKPESPASRL